jgi:inosine/xanthosine triphosphatase
MTIINICVGSLNPTKINAVKLAFNKYYDNFHIDQINVISKTSNQPIGMEAIIQGAINRAECAIHYLIYDKKIDTCIYGVGIEAGLVNIAYAKTNYMDFQFCVIMDENKDITLGSGVAFEYPSSVINEILSNRDTEIGDIMGRLANNKNLKNESGAISFLSKNIINRTEILSQAVISALLPRINPELYEL